MTEPTRLFDFIYFQQENCPLDVAMTSKVAGEWKSYNTSEVIEAVNMASKGLLKLGVQPGDKIALISHNNRCEWNIMDMAILQIGAIDVPIYPTMSENDYEYILNHSESKFCFLSNDELYNKVKNVQGNVPALQEIYTFEEISGAKNWNEVLQSGKDGDQSKVDELKSGVKETDLATLIYTSGTTGLPKGVMLTHSNIASNVRASQERLPAFVQGETRCLSFLPVSHIFERMMHYLYMYGSIKIYFAESIDTIKEDLNLAKPHAFSAVPRLLEKFYDGIVAKGAEAGGIKSKLFAWAVKIALEWEPNGDNGGFYEWKLGIARKLVFSKVKTALGLTEIGAVACGSAALQPRLARFFNGAGIPVFEGYGLTETSPVISVNTFSFPDMMKVGTVGVAIQDVDVKIAEDGEIICRGPNVMMGYYKDAEQTAEVLKDGWFHTGDIGVIEGRFIRITDRKKAMFKTSGGKYVAPQVIENSLKESTFIDQVMVVGENRKFPAALIVPDFAIAKRWFEQQGKEYPGDDALPGNNDLREAILADINKNNVKFGDWEQIKQFRILGEAFTIDGGELTPTMKIKRKPIMEKYNSVIDSIWD